jgi:mycofactocin precursor peptide peptidase
VSSGQSPHPKTRWRWVTSDSPMTHTRENDSSSRLAERSWPSVESPPVLLLPLGSTEQHGPHLPLDTDTRIAIAAAESIAALLGGGDIDVVVAPALAYGSSGEHQGFSGTISIGTPVLTSLLVEYGRSACTWAERVIVVNGHGGNVEALAGAVPLLRSEGRDVAWVPCAADAASERAPTSGLNPVDSHAGRVETSLLLHLARASVAEAHLEAGADAELADLLPRLRTEGVRAVSANGVLGDPRGATAAEGESIFNAILDEIVTRIAAGRVDQRGCLVTGS